VTTHFCAQSGHLEDEQSIVRCVLAVHTVHAVLNVVFILECQEQLSGILIAVFLCDHECGNEPTGELGKRVVVR
jgi:hypothetical protein